MSGHSPAASPRIRSSIWFGKIRQRSNIPLVFMTYANVVFSYGTERFMKTASEIGMDGLILPDVPYEEKRGI
ncbi:MAG: tryptophan synthase subunit alpha [Blautia sp.]